MTQRYTRRTPEQWQSILNEQANSGLSQAAFCQRNAIAFATFQTWRKKLNSPTVNTSASFVEVPRTEPDGAQALPLDQGLRVRLELGAGVVLELSRM